MSAPHRLTPLGLLFLAACGGHVSAAWPDTGARRFAGHVERIGGERRATGFWTFWYPDGETRQAQGWFEAGDLPEPASNASGGTRVPRAGRTKLWSFWDEEQKLLAEGSYAGSLRDDLWACWRGDGELCCSGPFEEGLPDGFHVTWRDGRRRDEHWYARGRLHGPRFVRDAAGQSVWSGEYEDGELVRSDPAGAPVPPLHLLETCAEAAEEGRRVTEPGSTTGGASPSGG